ncbi:hypothetical protein [Sphingopyxis sp.]|jgi:hypothetical protein|nr:hypothetical protein [Sphingopyxis sp.]
MKRAASGDDSYLAFKYEDLKRIGAKNCAAQQKKKAARCRTAYTI